MERFLRRDSVECDFLGKRKAVPRIGEDYQVELPVVVEKSAYETRPIPLDYYLGVSVPITSITEQHEEETETVVGLVPGSASNSWNDADKASFLLGLYIFSRNFGELKQFLETKKMEDILSFYYGEFYRSREYRQWSESRKPGKSGVEEVFTGLKKQRFLSRILPSLSDECKTATLQVFKTFEDKKIPFETFIFSIKEIIGINALVEAVGIGKGEEDLTTATPEPSRTKKVEKVKPEVVPTCRKANSSLTPDEIVEILNGGQRLSKARSHALFWEAVWPRLTARGWHAEEPKGQVYHASGLNNSPVFLVPGITKFLRRYLRQGHDYFDSISDVLNKIASDPSLLELDNDDDEEHGTKNDTDDVGKTVKRRCYLQPRATKSATEGMKFTVVDTCSGDWKPYKRRRLTACNNAEPHDDVPEVPVTRGQEIPSRTLVVALPAVPGNLRPTKRACYSRVGEDIVDEPLRRSSSTTQTAECNDIGISNDIPDSQQAIQIRHNFDLNLPPEPENESNGTEYEDDVTPQRRGTRNRPPTARALEAVAYGFLSTSSSSRSRRARGETEELPDGSDQSC